MLVVDEARLRDRKNVKRKGSDLLMTKQPVACLNRLFFDEKKKPEPNCSYRLPKTLHRHVYLTTSFSGL